MLSRSQNTSYKTTLLAWGFVVVACLSFLFAVASTHAHWCGHDEEVRKHTAHVHEKRVQQNYVEVPVSDDNELATVTTRDFLADQNYTSEWQPIRITFYTDSILGDTNQRTCYSGQSKYRYGNAADDGPDCSASIKTNCWKPCDSSLVITPTIADKIKDQILPAAKSKLESVLQVRKMEGNLVLDPGSNTCGSNGGVAIPAEMKNPGTPNTDVIIMITVRPTDEGVLGWGLACQSDQYGRPILGQFNLSPLLLQEALSTRIGVTVHEILHVLGFSSSKFSDYVDSSTNRTYDADNNLYVSEQRSHNGETVTIWKLKTPKLLEKVREHFNCDSLDGAELEDAGGSGTSGSHWEQRIFLNEMMTGSALLNPGGGPRLSELTLAVLEDSGWYKANYTNAEHVQWGRGFGCNFAQERCETGWPTWEKDKIDGYFCSELDQGHCSFDRKSKGYCDINTGMSLGGYYQHLAQSDAGGSNSLMDYCPYVVSFSNGDCTVTANGNSASTAATGESWGEMSRCFRSNLAVLGELNLQIPSDNRCYEYACVNGTSLHMYIGFQWVKCPEEGGEVSVDGYSGTLHCPKLREMCAEGENTPNAGNVKDSKGTISDWGNQFLNKLKQVPTWVWIAIGIGAAVFVVLGSFVIAIRVVQTKKNKKWKATRTVDVRNIPLERRA